MAHDPFEVAHGPGGPSAGVFQSAPPPRQRPRLWLHGLLFAATAVTTTFMGAVFYGRLPVEMAEFELIALVSDPRFVLAGLQFSAPLLAILLAHEMGHWLAARRHHLAATLPYFLPMPIPFLFSPGTLGAVIRIRDPILDRRQLLDVGAWGPIGGFLVTVPVLVVGLALSSTAELEPGDAMYYFGEPLLFRLLARGLFFPDLAPGFDLVLHPAAWAAWWGLFVTALNMLPFSQLDGGHVAYALFGRRHQRLVWWLWALLLPLGWAWPGWWVWAVIIAVMRPTHPPVWREEIELDDPRRRLGYLAFAIFILCFSPVPIQIVFGG